MYKLIILTVYTFSACISNSHTVETSQCPELLRRLVENGASVECNPAITKEMCSPETIFIPNFSLCKNCPACVQFLKPGDSEECVPEDEDPVWTQDPDCEGDACPVKVNWCLPGLRCQEPTLPTPMPGDTTPETTPETTPYLPQMVCELPPSDVTPVRDTQECLFRKSLMRLDMHHWDPDCEADGSFAPKQCKGGHFDGECFCVARDGTRIFGREWRLNSENQTCACSRRTYDLRSTHFTATFHCTPDGNYEPLQCDFDTGVCYCVDPQTGRMDGAVVTQNQWKSLPCYSNDYEEREKNEIYLRKCESEYAAGRDLQTVGLQHGVSVQLKTVKCDYDGSYAPTQSIGTRTSCVFKNGSRILDFFRPALPTMLCNCARDVYEYFPAQNRTLDLACQSQIGNYDIAYDFGSYASCVDADGYLFGDLVESKYICCLLREGCSDNTQAVCDEKGYRPCNMARYRN